ncbi:protein FAM91A1-like [Mercenaria mercenaria]|uniref:protein FAM91A1-like n=1 Tax=Mercenaria mercenaria TaxID=6596 RepID=UPI00234EC5EB|nr:protein FAM91A1-like [Mercenaria mercenaria]
MNADVENHIRQNHVWSKLPANVKQVLGNSQKEYEKAVVQFSVNNQLRYKTNLVKTVRKDERRYYEDLLQYSQDHLMLYPYHLSDVVVKGLRVTPFIYYINMMSDIMSQERSYDSLPNFTAADCLRLLGIGRNQYIDLMNQCRSSKKFFRRKPPRDLLPTKPVEAVTIDPWWVANIGYITEDDIRVCSIAEKNLIDRIIDLGSQTAGELNYKLLHGLYRRGLVYLDVPIQDDDFIILPPLENFVMNRVLGDYFETLLYKIFVSIDEHTTVAELSNVLQIDLQLVKMAVSMYCRLGFAKKKGADVSEEELHPSWKEMKPQSKKVTQDQLIIDWGDAIADVNEAPPNPSPVTKPTVVSDLVNLETSMDTVPTGATKRIAFLFDSTLTAFLMMGNLSPGLKSHAVTMFEVGKLSDESLDSFLSELEKVGFEAEGEARRYFVHALLLRDTVRFLRYNKSLCAENETGSAVDLIRCESLLSLDASTRSRVLNKNYSLLVSMAPLSYEIQPVSSCTPQHIGPAIPEVNSVWFKLYMYSLTGHGPPSLLLVKGKKLRRIPKIFLEYDRLLVTTWGHDPGVIATSNILLTLNDALSHSAVFVQAHGWQSEGRTVHVPFPLDTSTGSFAKSHFHNHCAIQSLKQEIDLEHLCGYITLLNTGRESRTIFKHDEDDEDFNININNSNPFGSLSGSIHSSDSGNNILDEPLNGLKDKSSAAMLASEIDLLEQESTQKGDNSDSPTEKPHSLDLKEETESLVEDEWCLLDCYFGIPLFEPNINKQICDKVVSQGLFNSNSLEKLLHSSRKMSLRLLNFISQYQDLLSGPDSDPMASQKDQCVPYPTQCLIFNSGVLSKWEC